MAGCGNALVRAFQEEGILVVVEIDVRVGVKVDRIRAGGEAPL